MIALTYDVPLIQNERGVPISFESDWLKAALDRAASKAGYKDWGPLDEISAVVAQYFQQGDGRTVIELPDLEKVVRATLRDVGYREIALRFRPINPFQSLSLVHRFKPSHGKHAPVFFRRLAERIEILHAAKVQEFHLYDLQPCVRRLLTDEAAMSWWSEPLMQARIVTFVRECVQRLSWTWKMRCTIR